MDKHAQIDKVVGNRVLQGKRKDSTKSQRLQASNQMPTVGGQRQQSMEVQTKLAARPRERLEKEDDGLS